MCRAGGQNSITGARCCFPWTPCRGRPGDARTTEFVAFLGQHFVKVGEASYSAFEPKMADEYDVVLFDAAREKTTNTIGLPPRPKLPLDYDRASVLIGGAGVMAVMPLQSKLDWL